MHAAAYFGDADGNKTLTSNDAAVALQVATASPGTGFNGFKLLDPLILAEHFVAETNRMLKRERRLTPDALRALRAYRWPGNVRELENVIERALVLADTDDLGVADLPPEVHAWVSQNVRPVPTWSPCPHWTWM